jgi:hypothetical protein
MNMNLDWPKSIEQNPSFQKWLETKVFARDEFNPKLFTASRLLYRYELQESLLEDVVHRGVPAAGFSKAQLSEAIQQSAVQCYGNDVAKWFHVNIHDGIVRVVERIGRYDYDYPLIPLYALLRYHEADEGGPTYAGLVSAEKKWLVLFDSGLEISVHGDQEFVDSVVEKLAVTSPSP